MDWELMHLISRGLVADLSLSSIVPGENREVHGLLPSLSQMKLPLKEILLIIDMFINQFVRVRGNFPSWLRLDG